MDVVSAGNAQTYEHRINALSDYIDKAREEMNTKGVWLFLATLGCWSISQSFLQVAGYMLTLYLFAELLRKNFGSSRSFLEQVRDLEAELVDIEKVDDRDHVIAKGLKELRELEETKLHGLTPYKETKVYIAIFLFYTASVGYAMWPKS